MKTKFMAILAAGLTLSAFSWVSFAPPAEAQVCNGNQNNRRAFKRYKRFRRNQQRVFRRNVRPANVNPYFVRGNNFYNRGFVNPYFVNQGLWGSIRNLF